MDFINSFELGEFCEFIILAIKKENKEKYERQWLAMLPKIPKYIPFDEFYDMMTGQNIDWRPVEEIIAEIDSAHARAKNGT